MKEKQFKWLIVFISPGFNTLTATRRYINLISSSVSGTLIPHPIITHTLFNKNINSRGLQVSPAPQDREREKHLPLRKQDVPTQASALRRLRPPNKIRFFFQNTIWGNRKLGGHLKLLHPFDRPFIYGFISFQKQSWFQVQHTLKTHS